MKKTEEKSPKYIHEETQSQKTTPKLQSWEQNNFSVILKIEIKGLPNLSSSDIKLKMKKHSLSLKISDQNSFKIKHLFDEVMPKKNKFNEKR